MKKIFAFGYVVIFHLSSCIFSAVAQPISISLEDSTRGVIRTDSANWEEAWIEMGGALPGAKMLLPKDLIVRLGERTAEVLSIDSIGAKFQSRLALSLVLDNSGSMFHNYDSLTKYCDSLVDSLPQGVRYQAVTFDDLPRSPEHSKTARPNVYIAQTHFKDSIKVIQNFWHNYDSIRTLYTPLYDAVRAGLQNIEERRLLFRDSLADILLVVTDGRDNASRTTIEVIREMLTELHARLFAINYRTEDARLEWLAAHTGGAFYIADDLADLRELLRQIRTRMSTSYHIRYRFPAFGPMGSPRTKGR